MLRNRGSSQNMRCVQPAHVDLCRLGIEILCELDDLQPGLAQCSTNGWAWLRLPRLDEQLDDLAHGLGLGHRLAALGTRSLRDANMNCCHVRGRQQGARSLKQHNNTAYMVHNNAVS